MFKGSSSPGDGKGRTILSLDGGGTRCASQLRILLEIFHRIDYDSKDQTSHGLVHTTRPCECFDMIGGSGTGGLVAILLVVFGLSADEALEAFIDVSQKVLDEALPLSSKERYERLRGIVENLLKKYEIGTDARLTGVNARDRGCRLVVPVMETANLSVPVRLRNQSIRDQNTLEITIMDAIFATCALPPMFEPVSVKESKWSRTFVSADQGRCNPTREIIKEAYESFGESGTVACLLSLGSGHQGVIRLLNAESYEDVGHEAHPNVVGMMKRMALDCERVAREMDDQILQSGLYMRLSVDQGMQGSRKAVVRRSVHRGVEAGRDAMDLIMADTLAYLDHHRVGQDVDRCVQMLLTREGLRTLHELHRSGGETAVSRSLPPMIGHFVRRENPRKEMCSIFFSEDGTIPLDRQIIMVVSGMGGLGKTQLVLHFAKEFRSHFSSILFVDSSSKESLEADMLRHIRSNPKYSRASFERALQVLAEPLPAHDSFQSQGTQTQPRQRPWLIIYDNCDDEGLNLQSYLPNCAHGCIIVTTRVRSLQNLAPSNALDLGTMSPEEAVETLLYYSGQRRRYTSTGSNPNTKGNENAMRKIADTLGYLPLALVQAASHIHETGDSWSRYLKDLGTHTGTVRLLSKAPKSQRDGYNISAFAAIQSTYIRLPRSAQKIFHLLGFIHCRDFPMELIGMAAKDRFGRQYHDYQIPRPDSYETARILLEECLCSGGTWDALAFEGAITTLRNYSLISLSPAKGTMLLYIHPVVGTWARTLVPNREAQRDHYAASLRIVAAGACHASGRLDQYLVNHILALRLQWNTLHANDKAAFAAVLHRTGEFTAGLKLRYGVISDLSSYFGNPLSGIGRTMHAKAKKEVVESYMELGRYADAKKFCHKLVGETFRSLGHLHVDFLDALKGYMEVLSASGDAEDLKTARKLLFGMHEVMQKDLGVENELVLIVRSSLAMIYYAQQKYDAAKELQDTVMLKWRQEFGSNDERAIEACENMARIYVALERYSEARYLQRDILRQREQAMGTDHRDTIRAKARLAMTLLHMQRYEEALHMNEVILYNRIRVLGANHVETAQAKMNLAWSLYAQRKWEEARALAREGHDVIKEVLGGEHPGCASAERLIKKLRRVYQVSGNEPPISTVEKEAIIVST